MDNQVAINSINEMPQDFELEELFERLLVLEKIEQGRKDVRSNRTFTHEEARQQLSKWLK